MNNNMNSAMKTVGVSLAVGTAAAGMLTAPAAKSSSRKRKMKKAAKKAANTINTIVDNMQDMIK